MTGPGAGKGVARRAGIGSTLLMVLAAMIVATGARAEAGRIDAAIERSASWLRDRQHADGSFSRDGEHLFRIWETANAVRVLAMLAPEGAAVRRGRAYLERERAGIGGLYYRPRDDPRAHDIEVSAVAALAFPRRHPEARALRAFIAGRQRDDGAWLIGDPYPPIDPRHRLFPSATCFALRPLAASGPGDLSRGRAYVARRQRSDGGWGRRWQFYGTAYYPLYACIPVLVGDEWRSERAAARDFLRRRQRDDGAWHDGGPGPSTALRTALALNGAVAGGAPVSGDTVRRGLEWLLAAQAGDGHWDGGHFPRHPNKSEDIFATAVAMEALLRSIRMVHRRLSGKPAP